ncbi:hypothetical protein W02_31050 [Nitrospira sp. KM1]|uniref:quinol:electron acceptor oxidoreductase subunit ActD n=1 Tax=Nitrospira sp. KM1 TaxID=1936990 RepID=UPI0013A74680|nr:quinol:electron acceptor oxidoreductase subunit ActD [Nitrospira sp. KM1]BCA55965.1 hypothetical protein W02_31050 [Nitrospira sp. KM1]
MPDVNPYSLFALYRPATPLTGLLTRLREQGLAEDAIELLTGTPLREASSARWKGIPVYLITLLSGLVGIGMGILFAAGTAVLYPIFTGGKPIVARPVVAIISYETMMLTAIVMTFAVLLVGLPAGRRGDGQYDHRVGDGYIGVVVRVEPQKVDEEKVYRTLELDDPVELRRA